MRLDNLQCRLRNVLRKFGYEVVRVSSSHRAESLLALHLAKVFDHLSINCVLDVGARFGEYGLRLRNNCFDGFIASFEPISSHFQVLQERSKNDPRWFSYKVALGSDDATAEINVTKQTQFSSFLMPNAYAQQAFGEAPSVQRTESVAVRRLDGLIGEVLSSISDPRIFLKMDTQGWDLEVLKGARACIGQVLALQSEVAVRASYDGMPNFFESLAELERLGFFLSGLFPVSLDPRLAIIEFDCVVIRDASEINVPPLPVSGAVAGKSPAAERSWRAWTSRLNAGPGRS